MCNCGNKRKQYQADQPVQNDISKNVQLKSKMWEDVYFEYTGLTALSVTGKITGKKYRFPRSGNRQAVDYRDALTMMGVPVLKRIK